MMNRSLRAMAAGCLAGAGLIVWMGGSGCETVETRTRALAMNPASTNLTEAGATVVFTLTWNGDLFGAVDTNAPAATVPLILPIAWSVSDPQLGTVRSSGDGLTAVYERRGSAVGNNYIIARDFGARYEAIGTVRQTNPSMRGSLTVEPSATTLAEPSETVVLVAKSHAGQSDLSQAQLPLRWMVSNPSLGAIRSSEGMTAVYERLGTTVGNNFITVRDASGLFEGTAVVSQQNEP